jgi:flagellar hook assembly protein FlgD
VYDVNGNLIKNLISEIRGSGKNYTNWNGTNNTNENIAGGVYLYRIDTESYSSTKKMILLK